jgi:signal transduction histidine kinase
MHQLTSEIRTSSYLLHPPLLDEEGLNAAISLYVRGLIERSGLDITFNISDGLEDFHATWNSPSSGWCRSV